MMNYRNVPIDQLHKLSTADLISQYNHVIRYGGSRNRITVIEKLLWTRDWFYAESIEDGDE